jgi:hypothetical protein
MTYREKTPIGFSKSTDLEHSKTMNQHNRSFFGDFMNKLEAGEKLKKYEDKLSKGAELIKM